MKQRPFFQTILYENNDYFVVNKPPLVATLADRFQTDTMILRAKKYISTAQVCHRLDKGTSGVLVFAKHPAAYAHLAKQFEAQSVEKTYHAVAEGIHTLKNHLVEAPITVNSHNKSVIDFKYGKPAATVFDTLQYFAKHTLLTCRPRTGKTHQIRVHAAYQKAPLVGDTLYGGHLFYLSEIKKKYRLPKNEEEKPLMTRVALHAFQIRFLGINNQSIEVEAPYAKDFKALVKQCMANTTL